MKKKNIINLIKYYSEENDAGFRNEAYEIARDFDESGDYQLAEYIMALLSSANTFVPQIQDNESTFFEKMSQSHETLPLPESIQNDIMGIINAIGHNAGINKFLFQGAPGTGKTETIFNVILSAYANDKTVLVCSNNNHPVSDIYKKMSESLFFSNNRTHKKENIIFKISEIINYNNDTNFFIETFRPGVFRKIYRKLAKYINNLGFNQKWNYIEGYYPLGCKYFFKNKLIKIQEMLRKSISLYS